MSVQKYRSRNLRLASLALIACIAAQSAFAQGASPGAAPPPGAETEARFALVIGNGDYPNVPLKNPANDAADLAKSLTGLGFSVSLVVNGDLAAMNRAIRDFGYAIKRPDAIALFYYSGHGVQYRGANYLIPARADIREADELPYAAINADQVYAKMESSGSRTNIIILDACRNNPFPGAERAGERGLAVTGAIQPPQSLIVYATAPGKTAQDGEGRNGVFTSALLKHIGAPGLDAELMIRKVRAEVIAATGGAQVPWHNSSISREGFSFAHALPSAPAAVAPAAEAAASRATGTLSIVSDPPGIDVIIDGGEIRTTPVSLEVAPGAHSFEPVATLAGKISYKGETKQWISVAAGASVEVPLRPEAARASLAFSLVPEGCEIFIDGESAGRAPLGPVDVTAGYHELRFEREGREPITRNPSALPDETTTIVWGAAPDQAIELQRKAIKLDGKPDSWEGIEPIFEYPAHVSLSFMGQVEYGIRRVYICKDDKYLYWRVDFNEKNPFSSHPKGMGKGITLVLNPWMEGLQRDFNMTAMYNAESNRTESYLGSWDGRAQKWSNISDGVISIKQSKTMFTARLELKWINKYCGEPGRLELALVNLDQDWQWVESSKETQRLGYVDFLK